MKECEKKIQRKIQFVETYEFIGIFRGSKCSNLFFAFSLLEDWGRDITQAQVLRIETDEKVHPERSLCYERRMDQLAPVALNRSCRMNGIYVGRERTV